MIKYSIILIAFSFMLGLLIHINPVIALAQLLSYSGKLIYDILMVLMSPLFVGFLISSFIFFFGFIYEPHDGRTYDL